MSIVLQRKDIFKVQLALQIEDIEKEIAELEAKLPKQNKTKQKSVTIPKKSNLLHQEGTFLKHLFNETNNLAQLYLLFLTILAILYTFLSFLRNCQIKENSSSYSDHMK